MNGMRLLDVGQVSVATTSGGGHPPEFYADSIVNKLIHVSETATPHIRAQAMAYQDQMREVVLRGIRSAIASDHDTIIARLKAAGLYDAAAFVQTLGR
jgi:hypothetical protein